MKSDLTIFLEKIAFLRMECIAHSPAKSSTIAEAYDKSVQLFKKHYLSPTIEEMKLLIAADELK